MAPHGQGPAGGSSSKRTGLVRTGRPPIAKNGAASLGAEYLCLAAALSSPVRRRAGLHSTGTCRSPPHSSDGRVTPHMTHQPKVSICVFSAEGNGPLTPAILGPCQDED